MNYAFRWVAAHICYYLGDWISYLPGWLAWLWYPVYNWLMIKSNELDRDDLGIWHPAKDDDASNQSH